MVVFDMRCTSRRDQKQGETMEYQPAEQPTSALRMLRLPEVKRWVGLGRSAIYERIKNKEFPSPVNVGPRAVAWISHEITKWMEDRIAASRGLFVTPTRAGMETA
jgi:prophage regulatory protein